MSVVLGLEGIDKNDVGVDVVGEHYVVIAAAGADGEAARVVGVEFAGRFDAHDEFYFFDGGGCGGRGRVRVGHLSVGAGRSSVVS